MSEAEHGQSRKAISLAILEDERIVIEGICCATPPVLRVASTQPRRVYGPIRQRQAAGAIVELGKQLEVKAKGIERPITLFEVSGIGGLHRLYLSQATEALTSLPEEIPFLYEIVDSTSLGGANYRGAWTKLSHREAEARLEKAVPPLTNINMKLLGADGREMSGTLYGKVLDTMPGSTSRFSIRFTSVTPEFEALLHNLIPPVAHDGPAVSQAQADCLRIGSRPGGATADTNSAYGQKLT
ncbi:MAG: hypothetical protein ACRECX_04610 [Methyloceanibacter sp.]|uniref:hypothetical protein n=1 Tax=Methyloceanibacter sp. TaxID=1965321 RepID=UPI003D6CA760